MSMSKFRFGFVCAGMIQQLVHVMVLGQGQGQGQQKEKDKDKDKTGSGKHMQTPSHTPSHTPAPLIDALFEMLLDDIRMPMPMVWYRLSFVVIFLLLC